ncbi:unnamed protein product [Amoebophrya sp. A120]|nr:unnamed protein product [Amoebophrya sp. A120]|eukprot:GSA120T00012899001.1
MIQDAVSQIFGDCTWLILLVVNLLLFYKFLASWTGYVLSPGDPPASFLSPTAVVPRVGKKAPQPKHVGLIIAHPDDEVMFFLPTIIRLLETNHVIHLYSVTNGNFDGLGPVREKELRQSCKYLHLASCTIGDFADGSVGKTASDKLQLVNSVKKFAAGKKLDLLLTFDQFGVSSHPDHIACCRAVEALLTTGPVGTVKHYGFLQTVPIWRKYAGWLEYYVVENCDKLRALAGDHEQPGSLAKVAAVNSKNANKHKLQLDSPLFCGAGSSFGQQVSLTLPISQQLTEAALQVYSRFDYPSTFIKFLAVHKSQLVWFRYLYCCFSSYFLVNKVAWVDAETVQKSLKAPPLGDTSGTTSLTTSSNNSGKQGRRGGSTTSTSTAKNSKRSNSKVGSGSSTSGTTKNGSTIGRVTSQINAVASSLAGDGASKQAVSSGTVGGAPVFQEDNQEQNCNAAQNSSIGNKKKENNMDNKCDGDHGKPKNESPNQEERLPANVGGEKTGSTCEFSATGEGNVASAADHASAQPAATPGAAAAAVPQYSNIVNDINEYEHDSSLQYDSSTDNTDDSTTDMPDTDTSCLTTTTTNTFGLTPASCHNRTKRLSTSTAGPLLHAMNSNFYASSPEKEKQGTTTQTGGTPTKHCSSAEDVLQDLEATPAHQPDVSTHAVMPAARSRTSSKQQPEFDDVDTTMATTADKTGSKHVLLNKDGEVQDQNGRGPSGPLVNGDGQDTSTVETETLQSQEKKKASPRREQIQKEKFGDVSSIHENSLIDLVEHLTEDVSPILDVAGAPVAVVMPSCSADLQGGVIIGGVANKKDLDRVAEEQDDEEQQITGTTSCSRTASRTNQQVHTTMNKKLSGKKAKKSKALALLSKPTSLVPTVTSGRSSSTVTTTTTMKSTSEDTEVADTEAAAEKKKLCSDKSSDKKNSKKELQADASCSAKEEDQQNDALTTSEGADDLLNINITENEQLPEVAEDNKNDMEMQMDENDRLLSRNNDENPLEDGSCLEDLDTDKMNSSVSRIKKIADRIMDGPKLKLPIERRRSPIEKKHGKGSDESDIKKGIFSSLKHSQSWTLEPMAEVLPGTTSLEEMSELKLPSCGGGGGYQDVEMKKRTNSKELASLSQMTSKYGTIGQSAAGGLSAVVDSKIGSKVGGVGSSGCIKHEGSLAVTKAAKTDCWLALENKIDNKKFGKKNKDFWAYSASENEPSSFLSEEPSTLLFGNSPIPTVEETLCFVDRDPAETSAVQTRKSEGRSGRRRGYMSLETSRELKKKMMNQEAADALDNSLLGGNLNNSFAAAAAGVAAGTADENNTTKGAAGATTNSTSGTNKGTTTGGPNTYSWADTTLSPSDGEHDNFGTANTNTTSATGISSSKNIYKAKPWMNASPAGAASAGGASSNAGGGATGAANNAGSGTGSNSSNHRNNLSSSQYNSTNDYGYNQHGQPYHGHQLQHGKRGIIGNNTSGSAYYNNRNNHYGMNHSGQQHQARGRDQHTSNSRYNNNFQRGYGHHGSFEKSGYGSQQGGRNNGARGAPAWPGATPNSMNSDQHFTLIDSKSLSACSSTAGTVGLGINWDNETNYPPGNMTTSINNIVRAANEGSCNDLLGVVGPLSAGAIGGPGGLLSGATGALSTTTAGVTTTTSTNALQQQLLGTATTPATNLMNGLDSVVSSTGAAVLVPSPAFAHAHSSPAIVQGDQLLAVQQQLIELDQGGGGQGLQLFTTTNNGTTNHRTFNQSQLGQDLMFHTTTSSNNSSNGMDGTTNVIDLTSLQQILQRSSTTGIGATSGTTTCAASTTTNTASCSILAGSNQPAPASTTLLANSIMQTPNNSASEQQQQQQLQANNTISTALGLGNTGASTPHAEQPQQLSQQQLQELASFAASMPPLTTNLQLVGAAGATTGTNGQQEQQQTAQILQQNLNGCAHHLLSTTGGDLLSSVSADTCASSGNNNCVISNTTSCTTATQQLVPLPMETSQSFVGTASNQNPLSHCPSLQLNFNNGGAGSGLVSTSNGHQQSAAHNNMYNAVEHQHQQQTNQGINTTTSTAPSVCWAETLGQLSGSEVNSHDLVRQLISQRQQLEQQPSVCAAAPPPAAPQPLIPLFTNPLNPTNAVIPPLNDNAFASSSNANINSSVLSTASEGAGAGNENVSSVSFTAGLRTNNELHPHSASPRRATSTPPARSASFGSLPPCMA